MSDIARPACDLRGLLAVILVIEDPVERLRRLATVDEGVSDLATQIRRYKRATILQLRSLDPPMTWPRIGSLLGVSAQRAEFIARNA